MAGSSARPGPDGRCAPAVRDHLGSARIARTAASRIRCRQHQSARARRLPALLVTGRAGRGAGEDGNGRARRSGRRRGDDRCRTSRCADLRPIPIYLARQGKVPDVVRDPLAGYVLGQATIRGVSPRWEDIGLSAITDIVQHAFGQIDLDRSPVELRAAGPRPGCPACAGQRFNFPAQLAEARGRGCARPTGSRLKR